MQLLYADASLPSSAAAFPHGVTVLPATLPVSCPSVELCSESLMTAGAERVRTLSERGDSQRTRWFNAVSETRGYAGPDLLISLSTDTSYTS